MYKIMLVEDEQLVRESMAQNIDWNTLGFSAPRVCANGQEAMEQIEHECPDVVITDICMPFVDGLELSGYIREHFPETVIVILTGFSEFAYAQKAIEYHIHNYMLKPISPDEFHRMLKNIAQDLDRKHSEKQLYHRAKNANDALQYHFFQNLLYQNPMQNFREQAEPGDTIGQVQLAYERLISYLLQRSPAHWTARPRSACAEPSIISSRTTATAT